MQQQVFFRGTLGLPEGVLPPQGVTLDIYTSGTETGDASSDQLITCSPYNMFFDYSACYVLIRASELNSLVSGGKTITGIEIENGVSGTATMLDFKIQVGHTTNSFLATSGGCETHFPSSSTSFVNSVSNLTTCFDANYFPSGNSWNAVSFSTNFIFNGTDNIVIFMTNQSGQYVISNRPKFKYGARNLSFRSALFQSDFSSSQNPFTAADSQSMLTTDSTTPASVNGSFPNLKIKY